MARQGRAEDYIDALEAEINLELEKQEAGERNGYFGEACIIEIGFDNDPTNFSIYPNMDDVDEVSNFLNIAGDDSAKDRLLACETACLPWSFFSYGDPFLGDLMGGASEGSYLPFVSES